MIFDLEKKEDLIKKFALHEKDTSSTEVQVALLTNRIVSLAPHFKQHKKDHSSRRGLLKLINNRRKLLRYLSKKNHDKYIKLISQLGLRK